MIAKRSFSYEVTGRLQLLSSVSLSSEMNGVSSSRNFIGMAALRIRGLLKLDEKLCSC